MKKLIYLLIFFLPVLVNAQLDLYKDSPLDYAWKGVGNAGFSAGLSNYISLAFSPSGQPYVAYQDGGNSNKASVMMFDGVSWVNVGNAGFSAGHAEPTSLAFNPSGQPYVAYQDGGNSYKATVMMFDGVSWVLVGNACFSAGSAGQPSLDFSPSGQPYVAYLDGENSGKGTVMKYDSVYVGVNEPQVSRLSFYPNPATDKITLTTSGIIKESNLAILNIEGQQLITRQLIERITVIDISNLPSGVYFMLLTNDKTIQVGKIIKQ